MGSSRCMSCKKSSLRLTRKIKKKIVKKHFNNRNVDWRSKFLPNITPGLVFKKIRASYMDGTLKKGAHHSSGNLTYYCDFDFDVGSDRRGRRRTHRVRVGCVPSDCPDCSHPVMLIITFFPDAKPEPISWERNLRSGNINFWNEERFIIRVVMNWKSQSQ